mmetsp:Transcript_5428/g.16609  ORF Transcript_5428/g.16609 Transcript_5428/m.16609 type:complete len:81 (+) Transcript_5428:1478-1720(+)
MLAVGDMKPQRSYASRRQVIICIRRIRFKRVPWVLPMTIVGAVAAVAVPRADGFTQLEWRLHNVGGGYEKLHRVCASAFV